MSIDKENFYELAKFLQNFSFHVEDEVQVPVKTMLDINSPFETATNSALKPFSEPGLKVTISYKNLFRILNMLNSKGYYHDDEYQIRMREEELIMENPELKQLHDQYKTLLYMLSGNEFDH